MLITTLMVMTTLAATPTTKMATEKQYAAAQEGVRKATCSMTKKQIQDVMKAAGVPNGISVNDSSTYMWFGPSKPNGGATCYVSISFFKSEETRVDTPFRFLESCTTVTVDSWNEVVTEEKKLYELKCDLTR